MEVVCLDEQATGNGYIEFTRDIAQKFNNDFKTNLFPLIKPLIFGEGTRVMSLRDGTKKMSKSDISEYSRIMLNDSPDQISQKIKKAKTDPLPLPAYTKAISKRPEAFNLLSIFAALESISIEKATQQYEGKEFSIFKKDLADLVVKKIQPIGKEINKLMNDQLYLDSIMTDGKNKAIVVADSVLTKVYDIIGLKKY